MHSFLCILLKKHIVRFIDPLNLKNERCNVFSDGQSKGLDLYSWMGNEVRRMISRPSTDKTAGCFNNEPDTTNISFACFYSFPKILLLFEQKLEN